MVLLALAVVAAVLDLTRSIAASAVKMSSFGAIWESVSPNTIVASKNAIETFGHPFIWDPLVSTILVLPAFLILWILAMLLLWIGQKREDRFGRFASR